MKNIEFGDYVSLVGDDDEVLYKVLEVDGNYIKIVDYYCSACYIYERIEYVDKIFKVKEKK